MQLAFGGIIRKWLADFSTFWRYAETAQSLVGRNNVPLTWSPYVFETSKST